MKVVFSLSSLVILIWLYPEKPSIKEYIELRSTLSTRTSMCGNRKSSSKLALFKSLYYTYTLILSPFLGTTTMLDTNCGHLTTSKKPTSHCLSISTFTLSTISEQVICSFYFSGMLPSFNGILCTIMLISKPSIYVLDQANTSVYLHSSEIKFSPFANSD